MFIIPNDFVNIDDRRISIYELLIVIAPFRKLSYAEELLHDGLHALLNDSLVMLPILYTIATKIAWISVSIFSNVLILLLRGWHGNNPT